MPINKKEGESKDDFISRCMSEEVGSGKEQGQAYAICISKWESFAGETQSVTDNTWSTEAPINVNLAKVSFDYDETLSTARGKELAKRAIDNGDEVYIISARQSKEGMLTVADELGIPHDRVFATGSNRAKVAKVKSLGIKNHYDNNSDVVKDLPRVGLQFKSVKKVLFNEDFDEDEVRKWKDLGFKISILSKRKIKRQDKKVWNKLKNVGLTEDALVFANVEDIHDRYDILFTDVDPITAKLNLTGSTEKGRIIAESPVKSLEDAIEKEIELRKSINMKFVTVNTYFTYREIPGIPALKGNSSRPFCKGILSMNKKWSFDEIMKLDNGMKGDIGQDPFTFRGGFYRNPENGQVTPWCRHEWWVQLEMI